MPANLSRYRKLTTWEQLKPELLESDLAPFEAAQIIPHLVTQENVHEILHDIRISLEPGYLTSLGELVKKFDLNADFTTREDRHFESFLDESGHLTLRFRVGLQLLREIRANQPDLLPATSDNVCRRVPLGELSETNEGRLVLSDGLLFNGVYFDERRPSGQLAAEAECRDGLHHGVVKYWYPSGSLQTIEQYWDGMPHGESCDYYESGKLQRWTINELGFVLEFKQWDEAGVLISHRFFDESHRSFLNATREKCGRPPLPPGLGGMQDGTA